MNQSTRGDPEILYSEPAGAFFENLEVQDDGSVLFTSYFGKEIKRWSPDAVTTFAALDVHPVSLLARPGGYTVFAHGASFTSGADFVHSMQLLMLDEQGAIESRMPLPEARFLNGCTRLDVDTVLIADSIAGVVWAYRSGAPKLEPFLADAAVAPQPPQPGEFALGANGIKIAQDFLYVSNSSTTSLLRVPISGGRPAGPLHVVSTPHGIDDFAITDDGRIIIATHRNDVEVLMPDGRLSVLTDQHAEGATAVAIGRGPSAGQIFVTTTGGLFAGLKANANLLRLPLPAL